MRRFASLLAGASLALSAAHAGAQVPAPPAAPAPPVATASPPVATASPSADPPYESWQHGGMSYGVWVRATRGTARRSTGMMITGISLALLGATLMGFGTGVYGSASGECHTVVTPDTSIQSCAPATGHATGMALLGAGLVTLGIGIPLTVLGAAEVPHAEAGARAPAPRLAFSLGMQSAGLTLRF